MKKAVAVIFTVLFFLPVMALAETLTFAIVEWPPLVIVENGQPEGISVNITREVCNRLGITPQFEVLPLKRAIRDLKDGRLCMASLFFKEERTEYLYYPEEYQYKVVNCLVALKQKKLSVKSLDDLKGKSVGVMDGYFYGDEFEKYEKANKVRSRDLEDIMRILEKERIDIAAVEENGFRYFCKQKGWQDRFEILYTLSEKPLYTAFPRKMGEKGEQMARQFGDTLKQMRADGSIDRILQKYR